MLTLILRDLRIGWASGGIVNALAFFLLGLLFDFNAVLVNIAWALLAGWAARRVGLVQRGMRGLERGAGLLFVAFGLKLALTEQPLSTTPHS